MRDSAVRKKWGQGRWALLAVYLLGCVLTWPQLPARIPHHFTFNGPPNAWAAKSVFVWFGLWTLALAMTLVFEAVARWTMRAPHLWNVPEKQRFLALSEAQRAPICAEMRRFLDITAVAIVLLFAILQYGMYAVATQPVDRLPLVVDAATIAFIAGLIGYAVVFGRRVKRLILSA